jgi:uncharacterized protein with von Willebrand factor type A (vWA) domain
MSGHERDDDGRRGDRRSDAGVTSGGNAPDFTAARDLVVTEVVRFERRLRAAGAAVPATAALPATEAIAAVGLSDRGAVRAALHATLVREHRDTATFDDLFEEFWYRLRTGLEATAAADDEARGEGRSDRDVATDVAGSLADEEAATDADVDVDVDADGPTPDGREGDRDEWAVQSRRVTDPDPGDGGGPALATAGDERAGTYSPAGGREAVDDSSTGVATVDAAILSRFERALASLSGRRWTSGGRETVDARRALRESLATGGVAASLPRRERDRTAFRACVLVDVSRSVLDALDRAYLLSVVDGLVADGRSVRAFFFDTDVREVTDAFATAAGDPASALARAEVAWGGGTRIGSSLTAVRERWPDAVDRRAVTLVVSDGLEVGEVDALEREMAWLARRSRAVVWLNPLAASTAWEPTCRGMAAALPYVDALFAFGGDADLADAAEQLTRRGSHGAVGYEYDFRDRGSERDRPLVGPGGGDSA